MKIKRLSITLFLILFMMQTMIAQTGMMPAQTGMQSQSLISYMNYSTDMISQESVDPNEYIVGSGDNFLIQINNLNTNTYTIDVSPVGDILIPGIGKVHVKGLNYKSAVNLIKDKCKQRFSTAEVDVNLNKVRNVKIPVFGAVQNSEMITLFTNSDVNDVTEPTVRTPLTAGTLQRREIADQIANGEYILPASLRLHDLLSILSLHHLAKDFAIEVRSEEDTSTVNIYDYYLQGDFDQNPYLYKIKSIYIPYADIKKSAFMFMVLSTPKRSFPLFQMKLSVSLSRGRYS
ncbi:MAG: polysaccharide biosynthesis/export family protein [Candidatus Marinimicrobia bacterium]|nr:polysaccharide biosynthesis/export family protein [Candidatus Neomarinimicrobiota bacterium]